ncbi:hypothetical protein [Moorena sp. SIO3H5]|uniref:hypothetical protein n=1 Tax=Moorena sp. SIO3H5 TaxID=2607834 RepID=UPI0013BE63E7|nr:hypothetical protein [Moorena sp. SIO3H5]NEO71833.1 hypothetical protein [Moorena sp. SIO3H5]
MMTYQTNLQRQQYQLASLVKQSQEVKKDLAELSIVRFSLCWSGETGEDCFTDGPGDHC